ncbi:hypothetical protein CGK74_13795 [Thauera propionica]|uniref:Uncharacterized protein n=1 Tax=Thauera propionica TaxID=2019431 RepID=A0A235EWA8_9RHOO|nr:hypothetical protein [Thauera propionica]OYD53281.1 hypothetical protein CGK74_13795 [Thauera propionica]
MNTRATNVIPINIRRRTETARAFKALADAAERGEIVGAAYAVIDSTGNTRQGVIGAACENQALAHYGAIRLAATLLWPDQD